VNQLKLNEQQSILTLHQAGWSNRAIARELGLNRETVGKYLRAQPAASAPASTGAEPPKPAISTAGSVAGRKSTCAVWAPQITTALAQGLTAQRIYQDLVTEYQFGGSYQSVKRFVRQLGATLPLPWRRMECEPGLEMQVDFGKGAWIEEGGQRKRPHVFRVVLSHSRKGYSEAVWQQTTENFIRCLENAFRYFGGVPHTTVIDNLRAAVTQADWYDPELNPKLAAFAEHYQTVILPTKPYTPRHKGKIEAGIKYVQDNALKGRVFGSLAAENQFLLECESRVADARIHGTTCQQVAEVFKTSEQPALRPLPPTLFPVFSEAQRTVHRDGHVEVAQTYYSVPPEYVGRKVWARWELRVVRIFNSRMEPIALHARQPPGRFSTAPEHIHIPDCFTLTTDNQPLNQNLYEPPSPPANLETITTSRSSADAVGPAPGSGRQPAEPCGFPQGMESNIELFAGPKPEPFPRKARILACRLPHRPGACPFLPRAQSQIPPSFSGLLCASVPLWFPSGKRLCVFALNPARASTRPISAYIHPYPPISAHIRPFPTIKKI